MPFAVRYAVRAFFRVAILDSRMVEKYNFAMLNVREILVSAGSRCTGMVGIAALCVALTACGQKGALYKPTAPEAKGRATLPQSIRPTPDAAVEAPAPAAAGTAR